MKVKSSNEPKASPLLASGSSVPALYVAIEISVRKEKITLLPTLRVAPGLTPGELE